MLHLVGCLYYSIQTCWNYDIYYQVCEWQGKNCTGIDYVTSYTVIVRVGHELKCRSDYSTAVPVV